MIVQKKTEYKPDIGEEIAGKRITESAGYIPPKTRIEEMIMAGKNLVDYRREKYDFPPDVEVDPKVVDEFFDPTRSPGFDVVDAQNMSQDVVNRLKAQSKKEKEVENGKSKKDDPKTYEKDDAKNTSNKGKVKDGETTEED